MKRFCTLLTTVLVIGLGAGLAAAQDDTGTQLIKQNYVNVVGLDGNGGICRNGEDFVQDGEAHGPMPGDANKSLLTDSKALDGDDLTAGTLGNNYNWLRDEDGDGIPNCEDGDYAPPLDGDGNQFKGGEDESLTLTVTKAFIDEDGDGINDLAKSGLPKENIYGVNGTATTSGNPSRLSYGAGEAQPESPLGPMDKPSFGPGVSSGIGEPVVNGSTTATQTGRR